MFLNPSMDKVPAKIKYGAIKSPRSPPAARATTNEETMQFKHATLEFDGPVAILRLDHQEVMNAVSMDMLGGLAEVLAYVLQAVTIGDLPHDSTPETRTGTEAHQQYVLFRLLVLTLSFE